MGSDEGSAQLRAEHEPRALPGLAVEPQRISRADEELQTDRVRAAERRQRAAERAAFDGLLEIADQAVREARELAGRMDRDTYRDLDRVRLALKRLLARPVSDGPYTGVTPQSHTAPRSRSG